MSTRQVAATFQKHWRGGADQAGNNTVVIGRESGRFCTAMYSFNTGNDSNKPITGIQFNWTWSSGQETYWLADGGVNPTIYYYITTISNDSAHINPSASSAYDGIVSINGSSPYLPSTTTISKNLNLGTTYYLYIFTTNTSYGWRYWLRNNVTVTLTQTDYTVCGAPTSVTASGIVTPDGSVTVSWSGATSGTNNTINGYRIYYKIASTATNPTSSDPYEDVSSTSTSGSYTLELSNATRGYKIVFGIKTKGTAGDNYWSEITPGGLVSINRLPSVPTLSVSTTDSIVIPSTSSGQSVTATPGSDSDSGQTYTVYYATTAAGTKYKYSSALTINPEQGESVQRFFWTYDGLEYSNDSVSCTVEKNSKPTISNINYSTVSSVTAFGENGTSDNNSTNYCLGFANACNPVMTFSKGTGTLRAYVQIRPTTETKTSLTPIKNTDFVYNLTDVNVNSTSSSLSQVNIDQIVESNYDIIYTSENKKYYRWRIGYIFNDGVEDSDLVYFPTNDKYYAVPGIPNFSEVHNQHGSDIATPGHIYNKARFKIYKDTSITNIGATALNNEISLPLTTSISEVSETEEGVTKTYKIIDVTLSQIPQSGSTVNFTITYSNANISKSVSTSMTECLHPNSTTFILNDSELKPFTDSGTLMTTLNNPFGIYTNLSEALSAYECNSTATEAIKFALSAQNNEVLRSWSVIAYNNDLLGLEIPETSIYPWGNALGVTKYDGTYTVTARVCIQNLYGAKFYSNPATYVLNFNEAPRTIAATPQYSPNGSSWTNLGTYCLQEGLIVRFATTCSAYSSGNLNFALTRNGTQVSSVIVPVSNSTSGITSASCNLDYSIGEITQASAINWGITVSNTTGSSSTSKTTNVVRHTTPNWSFNECSVTDTNGNYTLNFAYTISDVGVGITSPTTSTWSQQTYYVVDATNSAVTDSFTLTTGTSQKTIACLPSQQWDAKSLKLQMVSSVKSIENVVISTTSKNYYSNVIPVFKLSPTVAYRQNQLGINATSPQSDAILDIHQTTGHSKIYFQGINNSNDVFWDVDIPKGTIAYSVTGGSSYTLDLYNGYYTRPQIDTMIGWVEESLLNLL